MSSTQKTSVRFAPSPNGYLHLGHAFSAFFAYDKAGQAGSDFILRIEDIDTNRCNKTLEQQIYKDLEWIGIKWETPVRRQSDHWDDYRTALNKLDRLNLLYPCFCTRKDIKEEVDRSLSAPHGPEGIIYPGLCKNLSKETRAKKIEAGLPYTLRLDLEKALKHINKPLYWFDEEKGKQEAHPHEIGDAVLMRKDIPTSYHLSVVVDDHLQGITHVTRGEDLFYATHMHRVLQELLGYEPPLYHHHRLITDKNGKRFAKRNQSLSIKTLRENGYTPDDVKRMIESSPTSIL